MSLHRGRLGIVSEILRRLPEICESESASFSIRKRYPLNFKDRSRLCAHDLDLTAFQSSTRGKDRQLRRLRRNQRTAAADNNGSAPEAFREGYAEARRDPAGTHRGRR